MNSSGFALFARGSVIAICSSARRIPLALSRRGTPGQAKQKRIVNSRALVHLLITELLGLSFSEEGQLFCLADNPVGVLGEQESFI